MGAEVGGLVIRTQKIIGCALEVYNFLGNGFQERIYHRAFQVELKKMGLEYESETPMPIYYKNLNQPIGVRRLDLLVEKKVLIELKAISNITPAHHNQVLCYLAAYNIEIGLLFNFGEESLKFKRFILTNHPYQKNLQNIKKTKK